jgi:hypothetical protein
MVNLMQEMSFILVWEHFGSQVNCFAFRKLSETLCSVTMPYIQTNYIDLYIVLENFYVIGTMKVKCLLVFLLFVIVCVRVGGGEGQCLPTMIRLHNCNTAIMVEEDL